MTGLAASIGFERPAPRESRAPALVAAVVLHLGALALLTLGRPKAPLPLGTAVPITVLAHDPTTDSRAAEAAPETATARVETPTRAAKPPIPAAAPALATPPAAAPAPRAAPPSPLRRRPAPAPRLATPAPRAAPAPKLAAPPKPALAAKPRPTKAFSLDALQADIARAARASPSRPAFAARGPARAETAPRARPQAGAGAGQSVSASDLQGLQQLLERLWNPNCDAPGGETVIVPVRFSVGDDGRLTGRVVDIRPDAKPVVAAAARRAIDAVHEAEPYAQPYRGQAFTVNFDAHKACAGRP